MRVVLLDYRKAFDLVDHGTLAAKILLLRIPSGLARWVCNFLKDRRKQVKLSSYCFSECGRQRGREGGREAFHLEYLKAPTWTLALHPGGQLYLHT